MQDLRNNLLDSLDASDREIFPYLPYLLQDLWGLGSMAEYVIELVQRHISPANLKQVIDFGCGKGEVLIRLNKKFPFQGRGIDLVPEFIEAANTHSLNWETNENLVFSVGDIREEINRHRDVDLAIYGHDSEIFGNVSNSLRQISSSISKNGWVIFESVYSLEGGMEEFPDRNEFHNQLIESGLQLVDLIPWDLKRLKITNKNNTEFIEKRTNELIEKYPDQQEIFKSYLETQTQECKELEEALQCVTALLKK